MCFHANIVSRLVCRSALANWSHANMFFYVIVLVCHLVGRKTTEIVRYVATTVPEDPGFHIRCSVPMSYIDKDLNISG